MGFFCSQNFAEINKEKAHFAHILVAQLRKSLKSRKKQKLWNDKKTKENEEIVQQEQESRYKR